MKLALLAAAVAALLFYAYALQECFLFGYYRTMICQ